MKNVPIAEIIRGSKKSTTKTVSKLKTVPAKTATKPPVPTVVPMVTPRATTPPSAPLFPPLPVMQPTQPEEEARVAPRKATTPPPVIFPPPMFPPVPKPLTPIAPSEPPRVEPTITIPAFDKIPPFKPVDVTAAKPQLPVPVPVPALVPVPEKPAVPSAEEIRRKRQEEERLKQLKEEEERQKLLQQQRELAALKIAQTQRKIRLARLKLYFHKWKLYTDELRAIRIAKEEVEIPMKIH